MGSCVNCRKFFDLCQDQFSDSLSVPEAARNLGVHANLLRKWKEKYAVEDGAVRNGRLNGEERDELRRLRAENRRLRMEREILKKAAIFFVNEKS
jgi:transposase